MKPMRLVSRAPQLRSLDESIVPLINVVFLLLMFFIVAGHLSQPDAGNLTPPLSRSEQANSHGPHWLGLDQDGILYWQGQRQTLTQLSNAQLPANLELRVDATVEFHYLLPLLDKVKKQGVKKVSLVTLIDKGF